MTVDIQINNSTAADARFVTWAPSPCRIRVTNPAGATQPVVTITLRSVAPSSGGAVRFRKGSTGGFAATVSLQVPTDGTSVPFFVAGRTASTALDDVTVEARRANLVVGSVKLMVRIRKNANTLTAGERDRFVAAMARLNDRGAGRFADFRDMHTAAGSPQAHFAPGFLPWHRAYLIDLERELQAIDPSVALPYWRFDRAAANLFSLDFIGVADAVGTVQLSAGNPLQFWVTDGVPGINRRPFFNTSSAPPGVLSEANTLALGNLYAAFRSMEGNPHGAAHSTFGGFISSIPTAARDPLFFLLHCNVDRLWAKWQRQFGRFDPAVAAAYDSQPGLRLGHNLPDTMWPWNGVTGGSRPPTAPGGPLAPSQAVTAPGPQPLVRDMLDYQGRLSNISRLGFDYDDVAFA